MQQPVSVASTTRLFAPPQTGFSGAKKSPVTKPFAETFSLHQMCDSDTKTLHASSEELLQRAAKLDNSLREVARTIKKSISLCEAQEEQIGGVIDSGAVILASTAPSVTASYVPPAQTPQHHQYQLQHPEHHQHDTHHRTTNVPPQNDNNDGVKEYEPLPSVPLQAEYQRRATSRNEEDTMLASRSRGSSRNIATPVPSNNSKSPGRLPSVQTHETITLSQQRGSTSRGGSEAAQLAAAEVFGRSTATPAASSLSSRQPSNNRVGGSTSVHPPEEHHFHTTNRDPSIHVIRTSPPMVATPAQIDSRAPSSLPLHQQPPPQRSVSGDNFHHQHQHNIDREHQRVEYQSEVASRATSHQHKGTSSSAAPSAVHSREPSPATFDEVPQPHPYRTPHHQLQGTPVMTTPVASKVVIQTPHVLTSSSQQPHSGEGGDEDDDALVQALLIQRLREKEAALLNSAAKRGATPIRAERTVASSVHRSKPQHSVGSYGAAPVAVVPHHLQHTPTANGATGMDGMMLASSVLNASTPTTTTSTTSPNSHEAFLKRQHLMKQ